MASLIEEDLKLHELNAQTIAKYTHDIANLCKRQSIRFDTS